MKKIIVCLFCMSLAWTSLAFSAQLTDEDCSEEIIISYFPAPFVKKTLKENKIAEDKWEAIATDLDGKNSEVVKIVEEKAESMNPNPLLDPSQRDEAVAIFREALTTTFTDVMKKHGITDQQQIKAMLDDIQQQKAKRFSECLQKHMQEMKR